MNKNVLITGVSSGLGLDLTQKLLELGYNVIGLTRHVQKANKIIGLNHNLNLIECDISDEKSIKNAFSKITKLDFLINNASLFLSKKFTDYKCNEIHKIIDTNLKGTIFCTLESLKIMDGGRIINIGSVSGLHGIENQTIYSSTKFGLAGFSESLSQELKKINVTTINPGGINTPLWNADNPYNGDVNTLLTTDDIISTILYVMNLKEHVVVKEITIFPKSEWH